MEKTVEEMRAKRANRVTLIEVSVGESSGYSTESLKQAFELLVPDTELKDAELMLTTAEGRDVLIKRIVMEQ